MLDAIRTAWSKWRVNRRHYQIDRAMYKAGGGRGPQRGGPDGGKHHDSEVKNIGSSTPGGYGGP